MKTIKLTIITILTLQMMLLSSCNDWLDLVPEDAVPKQDYWKTKEDVQSALNGIYCGMLTNNVARNMVLWGELRADMMTTGRQILSPYYLITRGEISSTNTFCVYSGFYTVINNCNLLLKFSDLAYNNDNSFTLSELHEYKAQAIAVRSLMYFYLVRTFSDVPFPLEGYSDNSQQLTIAKTEQNAILDSITSHLEMIINNNWIPISYSNVDNAMNKGYMTRYAVDALLADIYLWKDEYQNCIDACNEIINSGQFALIPVEKALAVNTDNDSVYYSTSYGADNLFQKLYIDGNSVESIFELQFAKDIVNPFYSFFVNTSSRYMMPNEEHIKSEVFIPTEKEGLSSIFLDIRRDIASKGGYLWKWAGVSFNGTDVYNSDEMINNVIIYRLAQVYLMKAEALCQLGKNENNQEYLKEAYDLLSEIRNRAGAVETTDIKINYDGSIDPDQLEALIIDEAGREMMFEGKRWFDVLRNAKRNNYANINYLMQIVPYSITADKVYSVKVKYQNKNSHYLPLPQDDIERNNLLKQNPFYESSK